MNRHPGTTMVVARRMSRFMWQSIGLYWAILLVVYVVVAGSLALGDVLERSMWENIGGPPPRYWLASMGLVTVLQLRVYVANGVTRRQVAEALLVLWTWLAMFFAAVLALGYAIERPLYAAGGVLGSLEEPYPVNNPGDAIAVFAVNSVLNLVYLVGFAIVGIAFYRFGAWLGLVSIPLALIPLLAAELALDARWGGETINAALDLPVAPLPAGLGISLLVLAAVLAVAYQLYRTMPIRPSAAR